LSLVVVTILTQLTASTASAEQIWKAADGVYRFGDPAQGYYSMFVVTEEGVIAVEPISIQHSKGLLQAIRNVTEKPVLYLLHSHNHWDHSKGGQVFRDQGATIVAHVKAVEWMKDNPHPDLVIPDVVWSGNRKDIVLGGKTIELHHTGMSHGFGMTVFLVPGEQVAYIADIVTPNRTLFSIADFNIKEWTRTLKDVEKLGFQTAIYSHSHAKDPFGTKSDVIQTREFIQDLQSAINTEFKKGTSFYEVPNTVKLPKYGHWDLYNEWLPLNVWAMMLQMEMEPFSWGPEPKSPSR
jgi:glyoxylase-like metal-dependent hydrolase (beta-lactamase superfamily II)